MANTKSAIKRIRQTNTRAAINRRNKTRLRSQLKKLQRAIEGKDAATAEQLLKSTLGVVDHAVQKDVIKKGNASRVKSRLTVRVNSLQAASSPPSEAK